MASTEVPVDVCVVAAPAKKLHGYRSREVAEELCLIDSELLRKINPNELQNGAWMKKDKVSSIVLCCGAVVRVCVCVCCLLYTSPSPRDATLSRMPSSA